MSKKSEFIKFINDNLMSKLDENDVPENVLFYWNTLKQVDDKEKPLFTDNGKLVLKYAKEHPEHPIWKSKEIAEGLFLGSRVVSGAMRKLVTDGYFEKMGDNPVVYALTEQGKNIIIED